MLPPAEANICSFQHLHESLGHVNKIRLQQMIRNQAVHSLDNIKDKDFFCEGCAYGKMHRLPYDKHEDGDDKYEIGKCIYTDLCGPMSTSLGDSK